MRLDKNRPQTTSPALDPRAPASLESPSGARGSEAAPTADRWSSPATRLVRSRSLEPLAAPALRRTPSAPGSLAAEPTRIGPGFGKTHYHPDAPWPAIRGDLQNTGCHNVLLAQGVSAHPDIPMRPQHFHTGNSVFSTPIIGPREQVLVGSADKKFYAFSPIDRAKKWEFTTEECIDSAACVDAAGHIYVPSCDGRVYVLGQDGAEQRAPYDALKDRPGYSPSTIYWWEANVAIGPTGHLYGGNDNFYLHAIDRAAMKLEWATTTGMNIWSAPAFDGEGRVFTGSFDMRVYAMDEATGRVRWQTPSGNLIAASPALDRKTGQIYLGNFAGEVLAFDKDTGRPTPVAKTGGPIYASMAIAPDGLGYVGSADGLMYAIDLAKREVVGTFDTGSPIRSSASIGPDPERKSPYLVYFGGGNGLIYALEPRALQRRWSYDTRVGITGLEDYPNINASIALGRHGLATASASGDVIYVPYHYYLSGGDLPGVDRRPGDGLPQSGAFFQFVSPGGTESEAVLTERAEDQPLTFDALQTLSLGLLNRADGKTVPGAIVPGSVAVTIEPPLEHEVSIQPGGKQLNVVPTEIPVPGQRYTVRVSASVETPSGERRTVSGAIAAEVPPVSDAPPISALKDRPFRISHMSVYDPSIIPSFDQIGIASLSIDVRVVDTDAATGKVSAWGVLKFGASEDGSNVGVPDGRNLLFAFGGKYRDGMLMLEAEKPWFEITAFPVPLKTLRFAGRVPTGSEPVDGGSIRAEVRVPSLGEAMKKTLTGNKPAALRVVEKMRADQRRAEAGTKSLGQRVRAYFPASMSPAYLGSMATSLYRSGRFVVNALTQKPQRAWEVMDEEGRFSGVGTFRSTPIAKTEGSDPRTLGVVESIAYDARRGEVTAQVKTGERFNDKTSVASLLLVDAATGQPIPLDYNYGTSTCHDLDAGTLEVKLKLPKTERPSGDVKAIALVDTTPIGEATLRL